MTFAYSCGMTREEVEAEVAEAERDTEALEAAWQVEIDAYLKSLDKDKRHNIKRRAKKNYDEAMRRARKKNAVPAWLTDEDKAAILKLYELVVALERVTRVPHAVDHIIPLVGICRKTWLASGKIAYHRTVCGLHVPDNLRVIPLQTNRKIKKDWFDSNWPEHDMRWYTSDEPSVIYDGDEEIPF